MATPEPPATAAEAGAAPAYASGAPWTTKPSWTQPAGAPTPVAGQACPAWVHDRYAAQGPDSRWYPTWHPETDPQYGCRFGHEHGDDPNGSPALNGRVVLFGYAHQVAMGTLEPHTGYKVFRWDDIRTTNGPSHDGASVVMMLHQGTSGAARFTAVFHSIQVDYVNPADGREIHIMMLAPFGTLLVGCGANDPNMVLSQRQAEVPGARQVSADTCFVPPNIPYEDWITALYVGSDGTGSWKAYLDPHFAVFNPNTYCMPESGACQLGYSDTRARTGADPAGVDSDFKGTKREAYLNQVWLANAGGDSTVWTDPYGTLVSPAAPGGIAQYVAAVNVEPQVNSSAFGADHNPDPDGSVHAPN